MDRTNIIEQLSIPCDLVVLDEVDSTNDTLKRLGIQKDTRQLTMPLVVIAESQSAGKGRLGRTWTSPRGGVYLSLLVCLRVPGERLGALSLVVACAIRKALCELVSANFSPADSSLVRLGIKWPNDIVARQGDRSGKLVGILIETGNSPEQVVIGVGINVLRSGDDAGGADGRAFYLSDIATGVSRETAAAYVINEIAAYLLCWEEHSFSFKPFKAEYMQHLTLKNEEVIVRHIDGSIIAQGVVQGIDDQGHLLVLDPSSGNGAQSITAGDVTLRDI